MLLNFVAIIVFYASCNMVNEELVQNSFNIFYVFKKILLFIEIKVKLPNVRNILLKKINSQWDCIIYKYKCFKRILIGNRKKRRVNGMR